MATCSSKDDLACVQLLVAPYMYSTCSLLQLEATSTTSIQYILRPPGLAAIFRSILQTPIPSFILSSKHSPIHSSNYAPSCLALSTQSSFQVAASLNPMSPGRAPRHLLTGKRVPLHGCPKVWIDAPTGECMIGFMNGRMFE